MHNFRELIVWKKSRALVKDVYALTAELPSSEKFNLSAQMQSSAVSVSSNIAEGSGRGFDIDFARFLDMAMGSAHELESQLLVSFDLGFLNQERMDQVVQQLWEIERMIVGLINKLRGSK
jgi:four helix bundle protein